MGFNFDDLLDQIQDKQAIEDELQELGRLPIDGPGPNGLTPGRVFALLSNPVYTGVGPFPQMIETEQWIKVASLAISRFGSELFLRVMLDSLQQSLEDVPK
jgi:hypothetical protein